MKEKKKTKSKKVKSFNDYFEECIRNRKIPKDTPPYLRKALERAILEYDKRLEKETNKVKKQKLEKETTKVNNQKLEKVTAKVFDQKLVKEKSAFENFATKYTIQGIPGYTPKMFFGAIYKTLKDFFENNGIIKFRVNFLTDMEKKTSDKIEKDKAYFTSGNLINMKSTNVNQLIRKSLYSIEGGLEEYQNNGSDWRLNQLINLKFIPLNITQQKGRLIFLFQIGYQIKRQLLIFKTKMRNAFFGVYLDIFILKKETNID